MPQVDAQKKSLVPSRAPTSIFDLLSWDISPSLKTYRASLAEFVAMTLFVWIGCGTVVSSQSLDAHDPTDPRDNTFLVNVALAFGLAIAVLVYTIAPISGGHLNPAVTLAFCLSGDMTVWTGLRYLVAQCAGSLLGAALVWGSMASNALNTTDGAFVACCDLRCWIAMYDQ